MLNICVDKRLLNICVDKRLLNICVDKRLLNICVDKRLLNICVDKRMLNLCVDKRLLNLCHILLTTFLWNHSDSLHNKGFSLYMFLIYFDLIMIAFTGTSMHTHLHQFFIIM